MKRFLVVLSREVFQVADVEVYAENAEAAKERVSEQLQAVLSRITWDDVDWTQAEVEEVEEMTE